VLRARVAAPWKLFWFFPAGTAAAAAMLFFIACGDCSAAGGKR